MPILGLKLTHVSQRGPGKLHMLGDGDGFTWPLGKYYTYRGLIAAPLGLKNRALITTDASLELK